MHDLSPGLMLDLMHIPNVHIIITTKMCQTRAQHIRVTETTISVTLTGLSAHTLWALNGLVAVLDLQLLSVNDKLPRLGSDRRTTKLSFVAVPECHTVDKKKMEQQLESHVVVLMSSVTANISARGNSDGQQCRCCCRQLTEDIGRCPGHFTGSACSYTDPGNDTHAHAE